MPGKQLHSAEKRFILKVLDFFEQEKRNKKFITPVDRVLNRTCMATGISKSTLLRIKREAKLSQHASGDEVTDTNISEPKKMRYSEDGASSSSTAATSDTDLLEPRTSSTDDLDQFFLSMSSTVKKFSPYIQAVVKNKIFTLVSEMEMKQLAPQQFQQQQEPTDIKCEIPDEDFETSSFIEHKHQSSPESWTEEKYIIHPS